MTFADRLDAAVTRTGNPILLGIDPHLDLLPEEFAGARDLARPRVERAALVERFCLGLVDVAAGRVPAIKPQSAFFETLGADGAHAWENVLAAACAAELLVVGDVKRGDIASTASAYARAHLAPPEGEPRCDAITVSPFLGYDTLEPFLDVCRDVDGGIFVLVRTSNPGSGALQCVGTPTVSEQLAATVEQLGATLRGSCGLSSVGAVVGATHPTELAKLRGLMPHAPLLLPGYGAQGGGASDVADAFLAGGRGVLVAASRSIAFAQRRPEHAHLAWKDASRAALDEMIEDLSAVAAP